VPVTFHVLRAEMDPERGGIRLVGRVDDGILVTGMVATGAGQRASVDELETVDDEEHGAVFRLTFDCDDPAAAGALREAWDAGTEVSLAY
jgi:hypothetical protein